MYVSTLDQTKFSLILKKRRVPSITELARRTGLHRNTIYHYLTGGSIYQKAFTIICKQLNVAPEQLLIKATKQNIITDEVALMIDQLYKRFPELTFVLFGSRSTGKANKYSDWDIGFLSQNTISHQTHLNVLKFADELTENSLNSLDLVNLNLADHDFIADNLASFIFLTGKLTDWYAFIKLNKIYGK